MTMFRLGSIIVGQLGRRLSQHNTNSSTQLRSIKTLNSNYQKLNKFGSKFSQITTENDEQTFLKTLNDPDVFGEQTAAYNKQEIEDDDDIREREFLENPPSRSQKLSTKQYADMIKEHFKNNRIKEAIDVVEQRMVKEDRVKPVNYIYNLLIGGCARAGYSKKAFEMFTKMKQRGLKVTGGTYTSLFNACANAPWTNDALNKANRLREIMIEKGHEPNEQTYNAMIKAYGRCHNIKTAFSLVDEMQEKRLNISVETMNFLLQACISDKTHGFRHALIVWHKMLRRRQIPDYYSFNLMLRCVKECDIGDKKVLEETIAMIAMLNQSHKLFEDSKNLQIESEVPKIESSEAMEQSAVNSSVVPHLSDIVEIGAPNLLSSAPHLGNLITLNEIKTAEDRLLLIGGTFGFLQEMEICKVSPDIKTFTELLEVMPSTQVAEKRLLRYIRNRGVKVDIDFFNILIKKRAIRFDYEGAREVMNMIKTARLTPDIVTYGVLALSCTNIEEAKILLQEMNDKGIRPNIQIIGAMLRQGCALKNFNYIEEMLNVILCEQMKPSERLLDNIKNFENECKEFINSKVKNVFIIIGIRIYLILFKFLEKQRCEKV